MPTAQPATYCADYRSEVPVGTSEGHKLPEPLGFGEGEKTVGLADTNMDLVSVPAELEVRLW